MRRSRSLANRRVEWEGAHPAGPTPDVAVPPVAQRDDAKVALAYLVCTVIYIVCLLIAIYVVFSNRLPRFVEAVVISVAYWHWVSSPVMWRQAESALVALGFLPPSPSPAEPRAPTAEGALPHQG